MKKFLTIFGIVIASIALLVGGYILFHKLFVNKGNSDAFSYVPSDAVFRQPPTLLTSTKISSC